MASSKKIKAKATPVGKRPKGCPFCGGPKLNRSGKYKGVTRWRCRNEGCGRSWLEPIGVAEHRAFAKMKVYAEENASKKPKAEKPQGAGNGNGKVKQEEQRSSNKEPKGEGFFVRCPSCRGIFHETTKEFDHSRQAHGAMFRLIEPYRSELNWYSFPENDSLSYACCECPDCGSQYCNADGRVMDLVPKSEINPKE